jgi:hypothetical protein
VKRGLGILPVIPAQTGAWPFAGFPPSVSMLGTTFEAASWASPFKSGVISQYREAVPFNARHLCVYADGTYVVDHQDEFNPDQGFPLQHALVDCPLGTAVACAVLGGLAGLAIGLAVLD